MGRQKSNRAICSSPPSTLSKIDYAKKEIDLEHLILSGITNQEEMAAALGVSAAFVNGRLKSIYERWTSQEALITVEMKRSRRIKQFESIAVRAYESFEKSKRALQEYSVSTKHCEDCGGVGRRKIEIPIKLKERVLKKTSEQSASCDLCDSADELIFDLIHPLQKGGEMKESNIRLLCRSCYLIQCKRRGITIECKECFGEGKDEYLPGKFQICLECNGDGLFIELPKCEHCLGKGKIITETTKTRGQVGDPAFLTVAKAALVEAAKLEGLVIGDSRTKIELSKLTQTVGSDGKLTQELEQMYWEAPDDLLIKAMAAIDELEHGSPKEQKKKILDISSMQVEE